MALAISRALELSNPTEPSALSSEPCDRDVLDAPCVSWRMFLCFHDGVQNSLGARHLSPVLIPFWGCRDAEDLANQIYFSVSYRKSLQEAGLELRDQKYLSTAAAEFFSGSASPFWIHRMCVADC